MSYNPELKLDDPKQYDIPIFPLTIWPDRYGGTWSGGKWLAAPWYPEEVAYQLDPKGDPNGDDNAAMDFWEVPHEAAKFIGRGATIEEAVKDLVRRSNEGWPT